MAYSDQDTAPDMFDPNPTRGQASGSKKLVAALIVVVRLPLILSWTLVRHFLGKSTELSLRHDLIRSTGRGIGLGIPLSVMRLFLMPLDLTGTLNSPRFQSSKDSLCQQVSDKKFAGYWVCKGPPRHFVKPAECDIVMFFIHGGGYQLGHPLMNIVQNLRLAEIAEDHGVTMSIFSLNYSLAPEATWPVQPNEAVEAYRYLIEQQHIQPSRIIISGQSAGGHLALALLQELEIRHLPKPGGAFLSCPWVDLTNSGPSVSRNKHKDSLNKSALDNGVKDLFHNSPIRPSEKEMVMDFSQPRHQYLTQTWKDILPKFTWIDVGTHDIFFDSISKFVSNATSDGAMAELAPVEGQPHAWEFGADLFDTKKYLRLAPGSNVGELMPGARYLGNGLLKVWQKMSEKQ